MRILSDYRGPVALADVPRFSGAGGAARPPVQVSSPAGEGGEGGEASTYGPDALVRGGRDGRGGQGDDAARAERRMLTLLQARDSQVRHDEEARGEAVGSRAYIYQAGPDGRQYAVGTAPHLVREGEEASGEFEAGGSATLPALPSGSGNGEDREFESRLQARDRLVRAHEHAHMAAGGGQVAGVARYDYQTGPDGRQYAVGGSVSVVMTSVPGDPEATRRSANAAERAAMAPGGPSGQDYTVAANARRMRARAAAEEQRLEEVSAQANAGLSPGAERYLSRAMKAYARQAMAVGA